MRENEIDILCIQARIDKNVTEIIKIIEIWMKPAPLLHLQKIDQIQFLNNRIYRILILTGQNCSSTLACP